MYKSDCVWNGRRHSGCQMADSRGRLLGLMAPICHVDAVHRAANVTSAAVARVVRPAISR